MLIYLIHYIWQFKCSNHRQCCSASRRPRARMCGPFSLPPLTCRVCHLERLSYRGGTQVSSLLCCLQLFLSQRRYRRRSAPTSRHQGQPTIRHPIIGMPALVIYMTALSRTRMLLLLRWKQLQSGLYIHIIIGCVRIFDSKSTREGNSYYKKWTKRKPRSQGRRSIHLHWSFSTYIITALDTDAPLVYIIHAGLTALLFPSSNWPRATATEVLAALYWDLHCLCWTLWYLYSDGIWVMLKIYANWLFTASWDCLWLIVLIIRDSIA